VALPLGCTYAKYSFSPSLGSGWLYSHGSREVLFSFLSAPSGVALMAIQLRQAPLRLLVEPLQAASNAVVCGIEDLHTLFRLSVQVTPSLFLIIGLGCAGLSVIGP
jgi:hypothetical protein